MDWFEWVTARIAAIEQRLAGIIQHGPVAEVNEAEGWVRLSRGEGDDGPLLGPKIPYAQMAGGLKVHAPPAVGQNMTVISPTGDPRQAVALPMTWSDKNPSPGDGPDPVLTYGDVRIDVQPGAILVKVPRLFIECEGTTFELTGGGLKAVAPDYQWD